MPKDQDQPKDQKDDAREAGKIRAAELLAAAADENWLGV